MVDPARQRLIEDVFDAARRVRSEARGALLDERCAGDPELRAAVESLLEHDDPTWEPERGNLASAVRRISEHLADPTEIGPYRVLERLGEGAMGVVYLAEQLRPIHRRVAVKVVKPGMDTAAVLARFDAERDALSRMDHASVARALDAGRTVDGRPYFVMERVAGEPITRYCDRNELGVDERLELLARVCDGVQHAHQKGVLHRDIKPSNVLVSDAGGGTAEGAGEPAVKVIDFGVAKALYGRLGGTTLYTEIGQVVGTPEYMSPEQAEMGAADVDTRADVYSLGVLMYELLTGALPIDSSTLRSVSLERIPLLLREHDALLPSARLSKLDPAACAAAAKARGLEPKALIRRTRRDLDWIVAKATDKDRARRYGSASEFAADIRRALADEPVAAGPPTTGYVLRKLLRRYRVQAIAAGAVAGALVIGLAGMAWQATVAMRESRRAAEAEHVAERRLADVETEQRTAQSMLDFLSGILASGDPEMGGSSERSLRAVIDEAAAKLEADRPDSLDVEAHLRWLLGRTYVNLGAHREAERQLTAGLAAMEKLRGRDHPESILVLGTLGNTLRIMGERERSITMLADRVDRAKRSLGETDERTYVATGDLGSAMHAAHRIEDAERLHREAVDGLRRTQGPDGEQTLIQSVNLAADLRERGQLAEAEALLRDVSGRLAATQGEQQPRTLDANLMLASVVKRLGRLEEAASLATAVVDGRREAYGPDHPRTLLAMVELAEITALRGRLDEADELYRDALNRMERVLGPRDPNTLSAVNNYAILLQERGKPEQAEPLYRRVLLAREQQDGGREPSPETVSVLNNLASTLRLLNRTDEAVAIFERVLEAQRRRYGEKHSATMIARHNLGLTLVDAGRVAQALPLLEQAAADSAEALPPEHWQTAVLTASLGDCLRRLGRLEEAGAKLRASHAKLLAAMGADHRYVRRAAGYLADWCVAAGRPDEAAEWRAKAGSER